MNSKWAATDWNFNAAFQRFDEANKNFFKTLIGCVIACSLTKQAQIAQSWKKDLIETIISVLINLEVLSLFQIPFNRLKKSEIVRLWYIEVLYVFSFCFLPWLNAYLHYENKLTKNIRPTDILQMYTNIYQMFSELLNI